MPSMPYVAGLNIRLLCGMRMLRAVLHTPHVRRAPAAALTLQ
jgi:hypothetical protein